MANINVTVQGGQAISVDVGENTLAAANSATAAAAAASAAAASAAAAAETLDDVNAAGSTQVAAVTSAGVAASAAAKIAGGLGVGPDTLTTTTVGATTPDASTWPNAGNWVGNAQGAPFTGVLDSVSVRVSSAGAGVIHIVNPDRQTVVRSFAVSASSGLNTFASFGGYVIPAGHLVFYQAAAGNVRFVSGGSALSYPSSEFNGSLGDTVALTASANTMAIAFTVSGLPETYDERTRSLEQFAVRSALGLTGDALAGAFAQTIGTTEPDSFSMPAGSSYGLCVETRNRCILDSVSVRLSAAGLGQIDIVNLDTAVVEATFPVRAAAAGVSTFTIPGEYVLEPQRAVFYRSITGGLLRSLTGLANGRSLLFANTSYSGVGNGVTLAANTILLALAINTRTLPRAAGDRTNVFRQMFNSTPADWTGTGTAPFSISGGLVANGTGTWAGVARWNNFSACHRKTISSRVVVTDVASVFGLTATGQTSVPTGAVVVDGTAGTLGIFRRAAGGASATVARTVTIPALVSGRAYILEAVQRDNALIGRLTDTVTGTTTTVTCEFLEVNPGAGGDRIALQGQPAIVHLSGNVRHEWFDLTNDLPRRLRAVILGDSNLEAAVPNSNVPVGASWGYRLSQQMPVLCSGVPAGTTAHATARCAADLDPHIVDMVLIATGTNDTTQAIYRTDIAALIARIGSNGEPVLLTQPPRVSGTAVQQACNADVRARFFGAVRFIDIARRLSSGNDGITVDTATIFDSVHFNRAGQRIMAEQVAAEFPQFGRAVA